MNINEASVINLLEQLCSLAESRNEKIYFVGGVIRDLLLQRADALKDLDIVVEGDGAALAASFAEMAGGELKVFPKFLTAKVILFDGSKEALGNQSPNQFGATSSSQTQRDLDFVSTRSERYPSPGELPVVKIGDFSSDILRRDFSINALACPVRAMIRFLQDKSPFVDQVIDLTGGLKDLELRQVRVLHDASFIDDPTRLFRACRYAARIGGTLEQHTVHLFNQALSANVCQTVSYQRRIVEMRKLVGELVPKAAIKYVVELGLLDRSGLICEGAGDSFLEHFIAAEGLLQEKGLEDKDGVEVKDRHPSDEISLWDMTQHLILYHALEVAATGDERRVSDSDVQAITKGIEGDLSASAQAKNQNLKDKKEGGSRRGSTPDYTKKAVEIATAFGWRKKMISQVLNQLTRFKVGLVPMADVGSGIVVKDGVNRGVEDPRGERFSSYSEMMRLMAKVIAGDSGK